MALTAVGAAAADAQTPQRSAIVGRVTDASGASLPGARVTLGGASALGGATVLEVDEEGRYRFASLLPGAYVLTAEANGFQSRTYPDLELPVETTWTIDFRLEVPPVRERVDVQAPAPMLDTVSAAAPAVIGRDLLHYLPTTRTLTAILDLAPGVTNGVAFGGTQQSNGIMIDGVSLIEPVLGRSWVPIGYNWLDAVQIVALGAPAEYGQTTGATASGVLRSGSNRFAGLGEYIAAVPDWTGDNTATLPPTLRPQFTPRHMLSSQNANGQVGGPLRQDRVWFFTGADLSAERYRPFGYAGPETADRDDRLALLKVDAAATPRLRMQGFVERDRGTVTGEQLSNQSSTLETSGRRQRANDVWHARATWVPRPDTTVEARSGGYSGWSVFGPNDPARRNGPTPIWDVFTGQLSRNVSGLLEDARRAATLAVRLSHVRRARGSEHDVAAGLEAERTWARTYYGLPGGRVDRFFDGAYESTTLWDGDDIQTRNRRWTLYLQDRWSVSRSLTLEPGVRVESYGGRPRQGATVFRTRPVAWRLGAAWDVAATHRTVVRAHYGRYHDMLFSQIYSWHDVAGSTPLISVREIDGQVIELGRERFDIPPYPIDQELEQSHVDQYSAGVEHQMGRNVALEARYVARRFGNFIGYVDRRLDEWTPFAVRDPGEDGRSGTADDGGTLTSFVPYWWPAGERDLIIANPSGANRRYAALQLVARKRQADAWEGQASWTWSRTSGSIPGLDGTNATLGNLSPLGFGGAPDGTTSLRDWPATRSAFDYSELKLLGWVQVPHVGATIGAIYRRHNGQRWHRIASIVDPESSWSTYVPAEQPYSRVTPPVGLLDVRIEKSLDLPGTRGRVAFALETLNVANAGVARQFVAQSGARFGMPRVWTDPRTLRLGARWSF